MTAPVPREPWSDEVGLTDDEWAAFVRLRDRMRGESVECPWCAGSGKFWQAERGDMPCPACGASGQCDRWLALSGPIEDADGCWIDPDWEELPPELAVLRHRLSDYAMPCDDCYGQGEQRRGRCQVCHGSGQRTAWEEAIACDLPCPRCEGKGWGGTAMLEWPCAFCGQSGRIPARKLAEYANVVVGETHGLYVSISEIAMSGGPETYQQWRREHDPRQEASPGVYWQGIDFSQDDLSGLDLTEAILRGCVLRHLTNAKLAEADLSWAFLSDAEADGADFTGADLSGADLTNADLTRSTIEQAASLMGAVLSGAIGLSDEQVEICRTKGALFADR